MPAADPRRLDRLLYWRGQALLARDFREEAAQADERRAWHNRAVHQAFGIAAGLEVTPLDASTARTVAVSPGLAYDRTGREILVRRALTIAVPPLPPSTAEATFDLLLRLPRSPGCAGSESAELGWRPSSARRSIDDVPLARFGFFNETIEQDSRFSAPRTRPYARPRIASGSTLPGNTPWQPEEAPADLPRRSDRGTSIATRVDTSGAGFTEVPCYFAWLEGSLVDEVAGVFLPAMFTQVTDETLTGFVFRIWLPFPVRREGIERSVMARARTLNLRVTRTFAEVQRFALAQRLAVSWLGCEHAQRAALPHGFVPQHPEDW
jgi:hypothetical protein